MLDYKALGCECPEETYVDLPMHILSISLFFVTDDDCPYETSVDLLKHNLNLCHLDSVSTNINLFIWHTMHEILVKN